MPRLPHSDELILDLRKIEDYCLSPTHPRGRHKARVFREALGLARIDSRWLRSVLLEAAAAADAIELEPNPMGRRWRVDVPIARHDRRAVVRMLWLMRTGEETPRFVTCWVL
jgi:hypothetical protein